MPWLLAIALLHSAIVVEKRESLKSWTILLAILAFGFSLIGTFIVRSGVLTSVHAFANDPDRGIVILGILVLFVGGALTLFAARAPMMQSQGVFSIKSREASLIVNNIFLAVSAFVVFVGTIWPLIAEITFDRKLSVGPPFFNLAFTPLMIGLGIVLPIGAMLPWKRGKISIAFRKLRLAMVVALAFAGLVWSVQTGESLQAPLGLFLGTWLLFGSATDLFTRIGKSRNFWRLLRLPRADWGKFFAHSGLGVTMFAIAGMLAWSEEDIRVVRPGDDWSVGQFDLTLKNVRSERGPNFQSNIADIVLSQNDATIAILNPEKRFYPVAKMRTTEAAIDYRLLRDVYIVLGDQQDNGGWTVRTYIKPLANWIWAGAMIMALGGFLSLSDRRLRLGVGLSRVEYAVKENSAE